MQKIIGTYIVLMALISGCSPKIESVLSLQNNDTSVSVVFEEGKCNPVPSDIKVICEAVGDAFTIEVADTTVATIDNDGNIVTAEGWTSRQVTGDVYRMP